MPIEMKPITSSNIAAAGYDAETRVLDIQFQSGDTYSYDDVPAGVAEGLFSAASAGSYFYNNIKNRYRFYRG
jgi:hypothetical protein